jgi:hypothetical protein
MESGLAKRAAANHFRRVDWAQREKAQGQVAKTIGGSSFAIRGGDPSFRQRGWDEPQRYAHP